MSFIVIKQLEIGNGVYIYIGLWCYHSRLETNKCLNFETTAYVVLNDCSP